MMKHKRPTSNYITPCEAQDNEGEGPRKGFCNYFFHPMQDELCCSGKSNETEEQGRKCFQEPIY